MVVKKWETLYSRHCRETILTWASTQACRNFVQLCLEGYYNKTNFHRVIKDFMVQGGDPTGSGTGMVFSLKTQDAKDIE